MSEQTFAHGDSCCGCNCTDGELGFGGCCLTAFCPCFALCNAANDIGNSGALYCIATVLGCGCCALCSLGKDVEGKRGLKEHGDCWHCVHRVVNECKLYKEQGAVSAAPQAVEMADRK
ncbi:hypothetical protein THAOC_37540 [Thalassiosira oceanica]|uniref:Uncharacterized protein n=2 Tax=Thalassiosira oceanica TaxID=159749 RepID=K0R5S6_THAOC|nr:hypothetical protein THAOC_37540 [Thalassiosira oceanica]|eukprot:EJK43966.1 hypothetical protein THAOC_37540 [Thalassiosira oceanica]